MKLDPCKFCGGTPCDPFDEQIEVDSWIASIGCSRCDVMLTMQFTCPSPQAAIEHVTEIWNSKPAGAQ